MTYRIIKSNLGNSFFGRQSSGIKPFKIGSVSSFSPSSLTNLVGWYKADAGVQITGSGVGTWRNQAIPGVNDLAQATDASRPTLSVINERPALLFDGVDDWLHLNPWNWQANVDAYTVAVILRQLSGTVNDQFVSYGTNMIIRGVAADVAQFIGPAGLVSNNTASPITTTDTKLIIARWTGLSQSIYMDNTTSQDGKVNTTAAFASASNRLSVAANSAGTVNPNCLISEVIVMRAAATDVELSGIVSYYSASYLMGTPTINDVLSIPGLTLFLDSAGLTASTDYYRWTDRSAATTNSFTQSVLTAAPLTGGLFQGNVAPVFHNHFLADEAGNISSIYSLHSASVFIATTPFPPSLAGGASWNDHVLFGDTGANNAVGWRSGTAATRGFNAMQWDGTGISTPIIQHNSFNPAIVERHYQSGTRLELRVNNLITSSVGIVGAGTTVAQTMRIASGAISAGNPTGYTGSIYSVVAFNRRVSATEASIVRRYLGSKYVISLISGGMDY